VLPPAIVGYDELRPLSQGQGSSWLATSAAGDVVVKTLELPKGGKGDEIVSFNARAAAMSVLAHPNVATLLDRGKSGTLIYTVREYFPGSSLMALADMMSEPEKLRVAATVGRALEAAHRRGLAHGALKPENILFGPSEEPTLVDFALAPKTTLGPYAAPEQAAAHRLDPFVDQYAFAALIAWLLLGHPPGPSETISKDALLDTALRRCLSPFPSERLPQLDGLLGVLEAGTRPSGSNAPSPYSIEIDGAEYAISVRVSGKWTPESVGTCIEQVSRVLDKPGSHAIGYLLDPQSSCHSTAIEALAALHVRYRDRLRKIGFVSGTPEARGASVLIGRRVVGLPWKTFASADSMTSWLGEVGA